MTTRNPSPSETYEPERRNAQTAQPGSGHRPEEFDSQNPAIQVKRPGAPASGPEAGAAEHGEDPARRTEK